MGTKAALSVVATIERQWSHKIQTGSDFEWLEWNCAQYGVPWRTGGSSLLEYERLERAGFRLYLFAGNFLLLRRRIRKGKRHVEG